MKGNMNLTNWCTQRDEVEEIVQLLPELAPAGAFKEQNDWHNDTPLAQTIRLWQWMGALAVEPLQVAHTQYHLPQLLNDQHPSAINNDALHQLLCFTALLHDIGKAQTYERLPDGKTRCPNHEAVGAAMAPTIAARFAFSTQEIELITTLVRTHGEPYALYKAVTVSPAAEREGQVQTFERKHAAYLKLLLLLAYGDMVTSHLAQRNPFKYHGVLDFYQKWLQRLLNDE